MSPIAVHEASHVVTATVLNTPWTHAAVRPDGTGFLRFDGHQASWGDATLHRRAAIVALAGAHGEAIYREQRAFWSRSDHKIASSYLNSAAETFEELSFMVRRCVERYWPAIQRVAEHLELLGTISPQEARQCMQAPRS